MNEVVSSMNGTIWVFAGLLIAMVVVQAVIFLRHALSFNKKHNLVSNEELKSITRTGATAVIGPAMSVIVVALTLISMVGSATTFMRCGVIGAPTWELMMAQWSAASAGVEFGSPEFTHAVFTLCIFGMTFASAPYFINTIITLKPLDLAAKKASNDTSGKESFMPSLGKAAMMGIMGYSLFDYFLDLKKFVAMAVAGVVAYTIMSFVKKSGKKSLLGDLQTAIALICGMAAAQIVSTFLA